MKYNQIKTENKDEILIESNKYLEKFRIFENTDKYNSLKYHVFLLSDEIISDESDKKLIIFFRDEINRDLISLYSSYEYMIENNLSLEDLIS